ncbi:DNA-binding protein [Selenomonadales bacterium OttesenSCG-928-I06]|nr:DNA-binding protein [Selenomonadales bacterium OttesenSCG-928-I06]
MIDNYDLSPSLEDYLEELYRLSLTRPAVRVSEISNKLNVSLPSVSKALRKLKLKGYINYQRYGYIYLTEQGDIVGKFLIERNALLQNFLKLIGSDCNVSAEAEAMEHYLSKPTIFAIEQLVDFFNSHPKIYDEFKLKTAIKK